MICSDELKRAGLEERLVEPWLRTLTELKAAYAPSDLWSQFLSRCFSAEIPCEPFRCVYSALNSQCGDSRVPMPVWQPDRETREQSNLAQVMRERGITDYREFHRWSVQQKSLFWEMVIDRLGIRFSTPAECVLRDSAESGTYEFFPRSRLNIVQSCFQAHDDQIAIRFRNYDGVDDCWTYRDLASRSTQIAVALKQAGLGPGDCVAIDMPMTAESVAIYLAIVRGGMTVVSIADSFAPEEIAARLRIAPAKLVFTQDVIPRAGKQLPLYERVVQASTIPAVVISSGSRLEVALRDDDLSWEEFLSLAAQNSPQDAAIDAHSEPAAVTNILFSSGTTGDPKAIPWTQLTPIKAAMDGHFHQDIRPGDVVAWPTNLGWMMGPWLIYAALINRASIALDYGAPTEREFGEFVTQAGVTMLGVVPSLVKRWRVERTLEGLDWSALRVFSSTGESSCPEDYFYLMWVAGFRPVIEYCGGTEIGGGYLTGTVLQPAAPALFTTPALGMDFTILDESGAVASTGEAYLDPVSIGFSQRLLHRNHEEVYFRGCPRSESGRVLRRHGDEVEIVGDFYRALGRADDTMNLGGIKVSSAEIERVVSQVPGVQEAAAIAVPPSAGGPTELVVYFVATDTEPDLAAIQRQMQQQVREQLNPLFKISRVSPIKQLPRTASNKVMRRLLRTAHQST